MMDNIVQFLSAISPTLAAISPIVAVVLAYSLNKYSEKRMQNQLIETELRKEKMEILKSLMTGRVVTDWRYVQSLNIIEIIFADNQAVRTAWRELFQLYKEPKGTPEEQYMQVDKKHLKLLECIVNDLGYQKNIKWDDLSEKYNPGFVARQVDAQNAWNNIVTKISSMIERQDSTPFIAALNKFGDAINSIVELFNSLKNAQHEKDGNAIQEETKQS